MKNKLLILSLIIALFIIPSITEASITKTLAADTDLHPQGWVTGSLKFKEGTQVTLNDTMEVISGVLEYYEPLMPAGTALEGGTGNLFPKNIGRLLYKPDSPITFNELGEVVNGIVATDANVRIVDKRDYFLHTQERTLLIFNSDRSVLQATLAENTYLRPLGWRNYPLGDNAGFLLFKSGSEVRFGANGHALKGTLAKETAIGSVTFPAGCTLQFSETEPPRIAN